MGSFIDVRARRLWTHVDYLMGLRTRDDPHTVLPDVCRRCERWGAPRTADGKACENCVEP